MDIGEELNFSKSDRGYNKNKLHNIKDIILNIESNISYKFRKYFTKFLGTINFNRYNKSTKNDFSISREIMNNKMKELSKENLDKVRRYAGYIVNNKIAIGYAKSLTKNELSKQLIFHISSWKPSKLKVLSRQKEIDIALSVAWSIIIKGKWKMPIEYAKSEIMEYEFLEHKKKYRQIGAISPEIENLEVELNKMLGKFTDLSKEIKLIRNVVLV
jgi:hypothetical protein